MSNSHSTVASTTHPPTPPFSNATDSLESNHTIFRHRSEPEIPCFIGSSAREVLCTFERTLSGTKSEALLLWPQCPGGIAVFHGIAALNRIAACDCTGLATLFFPWNRSTAAAQRTLLVDRDFIYKVTLPTLNRMLPEATNHPAFGYVMALHSLNHILTSGKKNRRFEKALKADPSLAHPSLYEIMPQHGIREADLCSYDDRFLRRLRCHTWIAEREKYIEAAVDPSRTPFFLFGVHADAIHPQFFQIAGLDPRHDGRRPDIVLVDLTQHGRNRLGKNWKQPLTRFLEVVCSLYSSKCPPVLAVTDDVFVLESLRWDILKEYTNTAHKRPAPASVALHAKPDLFDPETITPGSLSEITAEVYGTDVMNIVDQGLKLRRAFLKAGDLEISSAVGNAIYAIQNIVSLPGPPRQFNDFLADNYNGYELLNLGAQFDHWAPRSRIKLALQQGSAGTNHNQLSEFLKAFDKLCVGIDTDNPGHKLFDKCIKSLVRKPTRSIIVFSRQTLRGFVEWRLENDDALSHMQSTLGSNLLLADRREAMEELELNQQEKDLFQQIVFVEPRADDLLHLLTLPRLPEKIFVLANLARVSQTLRRIRILLDIRGIEPVRVNLLAIEKEFKRALSGRLIDIPDLDAVLRSPRLDTLLDLTTASASNSGPTRIITTSGDLRIKAFDGSEVAFYDPDALQVFSQKLAKNLKTGDQICVFTPDFVSMAREKLNLTANASEVLPLYHRTVANAATKLPGDNMTSKVKALREKMLELEPELNLPSIQAMRYWIDVASLVDAPRNEVLPQAPRDRHHYLCFMRALGISEDLSHHYWDFGIFWTRSIRIRSGSAFHQVFMGILIDPHGAISRLPDNRRHDIWKIYETAEHHVVTVISNQREEKS